MLSIQQQITFLYTRDLARAAAFYRDLLGLPLVLDQGTCQIFRVAGEAFLGLCEREDAPLHGREAPVILTLVSSDVQGWYEHLRQQGVHFDTAPEFNVRYNIYHCFLRDADGYQLEIQQFYDPAWPLPMAS